jgi:adenylylsulfate reductase subunit B
MSVSINPSLCVSCGQCVRVCPGSLLEVSGDGPARILYPADCWGCASCVKVCEKGAVSVSLPPSLGGKGGKLSAREKDGSLEWTLSRPGGEIIKIMGSSGKPGEY